MSIYDPTDIRANEKAEGDRKDRQRLTQRQEADDFKWLMSDPRGRRVLWGLLETTGVYRSSFTGNSETFFREGQRIVGLTYLKKMMEHCPERYALMTKENTSDRATAE